MRDERGMVVLLLVVVLLTLTTTAVLAFGHASVLEALSQTQRLDQARAAMAARSGLAIAERALQDDLARADVPITRAVESSLDAWALLSEQSIPLGEDGALELDIRDAASKINLNGLVDAEGTPFGATRTFLEDALERIVDQMPGRREDKLYDPSDLADAIVDWIDSDDQTRLGDDEEDYYVRRLRAAAGPVDRPLWSVGELEDLPGVDPPLLEALAAYFTTYPLFPEDGEGGINPNTAPDHVLSLLYRGTGDDLRLLGENDVFAVLRTRDEGRIFCALSREEECVSLDSELGRPETTFPPLAFTSDVFTIRSEARVGESRACVTAVVDRTEPGAIETLAYRTGC